MLLPNYNICDHDPYLAGSLRLTGYHTNRLKQSRWYLGKYFAWNFDNDKTYQNELLSRYVLATSHILNDHGRTDHPRQQSNFTSDPQENQDSKATTKFPHYTILYAKPKDSRQDRHTRILILVQLEKSKDNICDHTNPSRACSISRIHWQRSHAPPENKIPALAGDEHSRGAAAPAGDCSVVNLLVNMDRVRIKPTGTMACFQILAPSP